MNIITADLTQLEARVAAEPAADQYRQIAARIHGIPPEQVTPEQRQAAKTVTFPLRWCK